MAVVPNPPYLPELAQGNKTERQFIKDLSLS